MKHGGKTFICLLSSFALTLGAKAITSDPGSLQHDEKTSSITSANSAGDTSYDTIVKRNVFDLREPRRDDPPSWTNLPPSNVTLTGIMTIFGRKQALFMVQKPPIPGKSADAPESCILTEGQRQGGLEVVEIDQKGALVKVRNDGVVSTITFEARKAETERVPMNLAAAHVGRPGFNSNFNRNAANVPPPPIP